MKEINIGDVFLVNIGFIQGLKGIGTTRPVRVTKKYKHYIQTETVEMTNGFGVATIPYKVCFMPMDLVHKLSEEEIEKWKGKSTTDLFFE